MKIAFRIDVSNDIGTGHFSRMSVLAEVFTELGCMCKFYKSEDEPVDYSGFDVIVLDTYMVDNAYIASLNAPGRTVVCYDDNALYTYDCDIILNANLHADELQFNYDGKTPLMLRGGKYALLRREFRDSLHVSVRKNANRVFVCFGGADIRNTTPRVIKALSWIEGIHITVVLGALTRCDEDVRALLCDNVSVYKAPESISKLMVECDIAVTAAGSMVYELASLGIPTITITQAENQLLIADYMSRNGLMRCAGSWDNLDFTLLRNEVEMLMRSFDRRTMESRSLVGIVDKNGAHNAAEEILQSRQSNETRL